MAPGLYVSPCPFCGSRSVSLDYQEGDTEAWVQCEDCLTQGPVATIGCRDPDEDGPIDLEAEAVSLWNKNDRRVEPILSVRCRIDTIGPDAICLGYGGLYLLELPFGIGAGEVGDECVLLVERLKPAALDPSALVVDNADHETGVITLRRAGEPERPE